MGANVATKYAIHFFDLNSLKALDAYLKKYIIMDEKKIPLGQNRTNGAVYSKINFKVEICSTL